MLPVGQFAEYDQPSNLYPLRLPAVIDTLQLRFPEAIEQLSSFFDERSVILSKTS